MDFSVAKEIDQLYTKLITEAPTWPVTRYLMQQRHQWWTQLMEWSDEKKQWLRKEDGLPWE